MGAVECHLTRSQSTHRPLVPKRLDRASNGKYRYIRRCLVRFWYGWAAGKTMAGCGSSTPSCCSPFLIFSKRTCCALAEERHQASAILRCQAARHAVGSQRSLGRSPPEQPQPRNQLEPIEREKLHLHSLASQNSGEKSSSKRPTARWWIPGQKDRLRSPSSF